METDPDIGLGTRLEARLRALCARLDLPFEARPTVRWMLIGIFLAREQPEFRQPRSGRPKGSGSGWLDRWILDVVEVVMSQGWDFENTLQRTIDQLVKRGLLRRDVHPTTHAKRLRRLRKHRATTSQSHARLDANFRALCARLNVPFEARPAIRWMLVGMLLASEQPEFKKRHRGRPKGSGGYRRDGRFLDIVEDVMRQGWDFETTLERTIAYAEKRGLLKSDVYRTTHKRRLRRLWEQRQQDRL
jgi:hypothetical protein